MYIYDKRGLEVHCLREHEHVTSLEFLRRFFLLVSVGDAGILRYQDTSTGAIVAQHRTRLGRCAPTPRDVVSALPEASTAVALKPGAEEALVLAELKQGGAHKWETVKS